MSHGCDVLTITPNPSIDLLHEIDHVVWDDANRVDPPRRRPGGQGINLARALRALGGSAHALLPLGGPAGAEMQDLLVADGLPFTAVPIDGATRTFAALQERATGRNLLINPRGPHMSGGDVTALLSAVNAAIGRLRPLRVVCCGSLPPGMPPDFYASIGALAKAAAAGFIADCDGEPLVHARNAGCDVLSPNLHEAGRLTGLPIHDVADAVRAARALVRGDTPGSAEVPLAAITLGARGAVLVTAEYATHACVHARGAGSAVGAGDTFLAGLLHAIQRGATPPDALRFAVAAGASVLSARGADLVDLDAMPALLDAVQLVEYE